MESASNYSVEVVAVVCQLFSVFGTIESASTGYSLQCKLSSGHLLHVASTSLPINSLGHAILDIRCAQNTVALSLSFLGQ